MYDAAGLVSPAVMEGGCASEAHFGVLDGGGPIAGDTTGRKTTCYVRFYTV